MSMATIQAEREMGIEEKEKEKEKEKWVTHYSSNHQILLVGEGDFSFSLSLALSFGSASNICASSLDPYDVVIKKYKKAKSHLENLEKLGALLLHGVDATKMKLHTDLKMRRFDRIIFNFPHAGFHGKEDNVRLIEMHRCLVGGFFGNARGMLWANGEVHVNHKTTNPFCHWKIEELGSQNSLALIGCVDFKKEDYPGYDNKRGDGLRCDEPFHLGKCSTFKFRFSHKAKKTSKSMANLNLRNVRSWKFKDNPTQTQKCPISFDFGYPQRDQIANMNHAPWHAGLPSTVSGRYEWSRNFYGSLTSVVDAYKTSYESNDMSHSRSQQFQDIPIQIQHCRPTTSFDFGYPRRNQIANMDHLAGHVELPSSFRNFDGRFITVNTYKTSYGMTYSVPEGPRLHSGRHDVQFQGTAFYDPSYSLPRARPDFDGDIIEVEDGAYVSYELYRSSVLKSASLKRMFLGQG